MKQLVKIGGVLVDLAQVRFVHPRGQITFDDGHETLVPPEDAKSLIDYFPAVVADSTRAVSDVVPGLESEEPFIMFPTFDGLSSVFAHRVADLTGFEVRAPGRAAILPQEGIPSLYEPWRKGSGEQSK